MKKPEIPALSGEVLWQNQEETIRAKLILILISLAMFAIAGEAIRLALTAAISGKTPQAFGIMPTRVLLGMDIPIVIAIALLGIVWVGYRLLKIVFEGMPVAVACDLPNLGTESGINVAWDGLSKPVRHFNFSEMSEIDVITRGTMGGGGHQVRIRVRGKKLAVTVARFDSSSDAERLLRTLIGRKKAALSEQNSETGN